MKKMFKSVVASALCILPLFVGAQSSDSLEELDLSANHCLNLHHPRGLKLSDFSGDYRSYSNSLGGIAVTSQNPVSGASIGSVGQLSISKTGAGIINFTSVASYVGPLGTNTVLSLSDLNFQIAITDADHGIGTIVIENYPTVGSNLNGTFVATKKRGVVESFIINVTGYSGTTPTLISSATLIFVERQ